VVVVEPAVVVVVGATVVVGAVVVVGAEAVVSGETDVEVAAVIVVVESALPAHPLNSTNTRSAVVGFTHSLYGGGSVSQ
jgi:hypothetical protein